MTRTENRKARKAPHWKRVATFGTLAIGVSMLPFSQALALDDYALPTGGNVVGGSATINYGAPGQLDVHQSTDRAVIDWSSFNIGKNATTEFYQPNAGSLTVNRVTGPGQDPTQILGTMKSNGTVMVLDRNGVVFGRDSRVDVGGIIASTGEVNTAAIMSGNGPISINNANSGAIINHGTMTVGDAGLAAFVAPTVSNSGLIQAKMGRVSLASGNTATVDLYGDGLVELAVDTPLQNALVENTGTINAQGGTVLMTAAAAKNVVNTVINMSGIVNVSSATVKGGKIILEGANTTVSGTLDASGKTGGGEILIGGDYLGTGTTRHADKTTITKDAVIKANTTGTSGDGGKVIVWSDKDTDFSGSIEAKGGSLSGNGGFIETSSAKHLNVGLDASVSVGSGNLLGKGGTWLIDPEDISITDAGTDGNAGTSDIATATINSTLNGGGNVTITTNAVTAGSGDITINNANILKSTSNNDATLTLQAHRNIYMTSSTINNTSSNKLNVVFNADRNADQDGAISVFSSSITTNGGYFVAGGGSGAIDSDGNGILGDAGTGADFVAAYGNALLPVAINYSGNLSTGIGSIYLNGVGANLATNSNNGVFTASGTIQTTTGSISIKGTSRGTTSSTANYGFQNGGGIIQTGSGKIDIVGKSTTTGTGTGNYGIFNQGTISSTSGAIKLEATGGASSGGTNVGFRMSAGSIKSGSNTLQITAIAGSGVNNDDYVISGGTIGGVGQSGAITLDVDKFSNSGTTITTTGTLLIKPRTASTTIGLGGGGGTLNLIDTELNLLNAGTLIIGDKDNGTGDVVIDSWDLYLPAKTHNIEVYGNDITVQDTDATAGVDYGISLGTGNLLLQARDNGGDAGTLLLNAAINKLIAGSSTVNLRADQDVVMNAANLIATTGSFNVLINSDRNADGVGGVLIESSTVRTNGGHFVIGGGANGAIDTDANGILGDAGTGLDNTATGALVTTASDTSGGGIGIYLKSALIETQAGQMALKGNGRNDASLNSGGITLTTGSVLRSTSGSIKINGKGQSTHNGTAVSRGVAIGSSSLIESTSGNITIVGQGSTNSTGNDNFGVSLTGGSDITMLGNGAIHIQGTGGTGINGDGIRIEDSGTTVTSQNGSITLTGTGGGSSVTAIDGVLINNGALVESKGAGNITIVGTAPNVAGGHFGTRILSSEILASGGANINVTGTGTTGNDIKLEGTGKLTTSGGGNTGSITVNTDSIVIDPTANITSAKDLIIKTRTAATTIGLGGGAGTLNLDDAELGRLSAARLIIGDNVNGTGDVTIDSWDLSGKNYSVEVYGNDITVNDTDATVGVDYGINLGTGNLLMHARDNAAIDLGELTFNAGIKKAIAGHSMLDLRADRNINIYTASNMTATTGSFDVIFNADRDADQDGAFAIFNSTVTTNGGKIIVGGGSGALGGANGILGDGDGTGADDVMAVGNIDRRQGIAMDNSTFSTGAGNVYLSGKGFSTSNTSLNGIGLFNASKILTTNGSVKLVGTAGNGGTGSSAGILMNIGTLIETQTGGISLKGTSGTTTAGVNNHGIYFNAATIRSTGTGPTLGEILIHGIGQVGFASGSYNYTNGSLISSIDANIKSMATTLANTTSTLSSWLGFTIQSTGAGNVTIDQGTVSGSSMTSATNGTARITANTGDVTIITDRITLNNYVDVNQNAIFDAGDLAISDSISSASGNVRIKTSAATTGITLGNATGGLAISDVALSTLSAGNKLIIGNDNPINDVTIDSWDMSGKTHDVEIYGNDITVQDTDATAGVDYGIKLGTGDLMIHARDNAAVDLGVLTLNAAINKLAAGHSKVDLRADENIIVNSGNIIANNGSSFDLIINADRDADNNGRTAINSATINTGGGYFVAGGGAGTVDSDGNGILGDAGNGADMVSMWGVGEIGFLLATSSLNTGAGAAVINANTTNSDAMDYGIRILTSSLATTTGDIIFRGEVHNAVQNFSHGIQISHDGVVQTNTGKITFTGRGSSNLAYNGSAGIALYSGSKILTNGNGSITLNAYGNTNAGNLIDMAVGANMIGGSNASGSIFINTDSVAFEDGNIQTSGNVYLTPTTASTHISIGSNTGPASHNPGILTLNDSEAAAFRAGTFIIGDSVNGTGDVTIDSWDLSGKTHNVEIYGNDIIIASGTGLQNNSNNSVILTAQDLIDVNGSIDLDGALTLNAGNAINIADADIVANGITADQPLTYDGTAGTSRTLNSGTGTLMLFGATAGDRNLTLIGDNMTLAGAITTGAGRTLTARAFTNSRDIILGGGAGGLNLNDTELSYLQSGGLLTIGTQSTGTGALTVNSAAFARDIALYGGNTILNGLSSTGKILVASQGAGNDITLTHDVVSDATGDAIILASADDFFNNAASAGNALRATNVNGRWLVYSERMDQNTRGGLMPHASEFGVSYPTAAAGTGNRLIYSSSTRPELTLKVNDGSVAYGGAYVPGSASYTITGGFVTGDTASNIGLTGDMTYATTYIAGTTQPSGTPYAGMITGTGIGTLASALGYSFSPTITAGALTVTGVVPPPPTPPTPTPTSPVVSDALWKLPPIVNYYSNMPKVSTTYTESLPSMTDMLNFAHDTNMSILGSDVIETEIEPAAGDLQTATEVQANLFAPDSATCLVVDGANGGCFIY